MASLCKLQGNHIIVYLTDEDPVTVHNYVTLLENGSPPPFAIPPTHDINRTAIIQREYERLCDLYLFCIKYGDRDHAADMHRDCVSIFSRSDQTGAYQIPDRVFVKNIYAGTQIMDSMRTFCVHSYGQYADDSVVNRSKNWRKKFLEDLCYHFLEMRGLRNRTPLPPNTGDISQ